MPKPSTNHGNSATSKFNYIKSVAGVAAGVLTLFAANPVVEGFVIANQVLDVSAKYAKLKLITPKQFKDELIDFDNRVYNNCTYSPFGSIQSAIPDDTQYSMYEDVLTRLSACGMLLAIRTRKDNIPGL